MFVTLESSTLGTTSKDAYLNQDIKTDPNTYWSRVAKMVFGVLFILPFGGMSLEPEDRLCYPESKDSLPTNHASWYLHTYIVPFHIECEFAFGN